MGFPAFPECFESAPTIVRRELHREDIAQLSIEVGAFRLGPLDHTDRDVPQCVKPPGDNPQRHRFAGSRFPGVAALGRVDDVALTEQIGRAVGRLVAQSGITLNFAPCADLMTNRFNPVIGIRSFGGDPALVARHTAAFVTGHQAAGVAACAKHYPGHGDTDVDTHLSVAVIHSDLDAMRATALVPFAAAVGAARNRVQSAARVAALHRVEGVGEQLLVCHPKHGEHVVEHGRPVLAGARVRGLSRASAGGARRVSAPPARRR